MFGEATRSDVEKAIHSLQIPVYSFNFRIGDDSTGDPAVWVTLILEDKILNDIWNNLEDMRHRVADTVRKTIGFEYWCYVSFQAKSEQQQQATR